MPSRSLDARYFERLYSENEDPWGFRTRPYEAEKYERTIEYLGGISYARGLEIGCSIGVLTKMLAERCEELLSVDISERALELAARHCASVPNVAFARMTLPHDFPTGVFDLIVLSEVGYYWSDEDLGLAKDRIARAATGGTLELVHYLPKVDEYVRDGDSVHEAFLADARFRRIRDYRANSYRIDVFEVA